MTTFFLVLIDLVVIMATFLWGVCCLLCVADATNGTRVAGWLVGAAVSLVVMVITICDLMGIMYQAWSWFL